MRYRFISAIIACLIFFKCFPQETNNIYLKEYEFLKEKYIAFEKNHGHYIESDNGTIHYLTIGNPSNPAVIWLHGSLSSSYEIVPFADSLLTNNLYIISIDYYGHGKSSSPKRDITFHHIADDIANILDKHGIEKSIIAGFSRGAYIATAFYDSYPSRVQSIILEDGGIVPFNQKFHQISPDSISRTIESMLFPKITLMNDFDSEFDAFQAMKEFNEFSDFSFINLINQRNNKWIIYKGIDEIYGFQTKESLNNLIFKPFLINSYAASMSKIDPLTIYRNLSTPLLLLEARSKSDPLPFAKENDSFVHIHKNNVTHKIFENTEHNIHYEQPKEFISTIIQFIKNTK